MKSGRSLIETAQSSMFVAGFSSPFTFEATPKAAFLKCHTWSTSSPVTIGKWYPYPVFFTSSIIFSIHAFESSSVSLATSTISTAPGLSFTKKSSSLKSGFSLAHSIV